MLNHILSDSRILLKGAYHVYRSTPSAQRTTDIAFSSLRNLLWKEAKRHVGKTNQTRPNFVAVALLRWDAEIGQLMYHGPTKFMQQKFHNRSGDIDSKPSLSSSNVESACPPHIKRVSLMITASQRASLESLGYSNETVKSLTPTVAHDLLERNVSCEEWIQAAKSASPSIAHPDQDRGDRSSESKPKSKALIFNGNESLFSQALAATTESSVPFRIRDETSTKQACEAASNHLYKNDDTSPANDMFDGSASVGNNVEWYEVIECTSEISEESVQIPFLNETSNKHSKEQRVALYRSIDEAKEFIKFKVSRFGDEREERIQYLIREKKRRE